MNNVAVRSISGVAFILVMLACLLFNKFLFAGLMVVIMSIMLLEFYNITMGHSYTFSKVLAIMAGIFLFGIMFAASTYHIPMRLIALAMIPIFIVMINSLYVKDKEEYGKFSNIYTGLLYIAVPIALSLTIPPCQMLNLCRFFRILAASAGFGRGCWLDRQKNL